VPGVVISFKSETLTPMMETSGSRTKRGTPTLTPHPG